MSNLAFEDQLHACLAEHISGYLSINSLTRLSGGASQETYRLEVETATGLKKFAIRRAPAAEIGESGGIGLVLEARLFDYAREAGVPGPEIIHVFTPSDKLGDGFLMEWMEGETLGNKIVRDDMFAEIRPKLAYQCGQILGRIHNIDLGQCGLTKDLKTVSTTEFIHQLWDQYKALNTLQPMIDYTARWLLDNQPEENRQCLVHNDFRNGNLMIDPEAGITAVLDWEVAHIGNPLRDLGWICTNSWRFGEYKLPVGGFGEREDLLAGYSAETGVHVDLEELRYWEVFGSFWWAVGCLRMGERYLNDPAVGVEYPAIGRRSSECQIDCVNYLIPGTVLMPEVEEQVSAQNMPDIGDLIGSVRTFLRQDASRNLTGRSRFLSRVSANSLDIVIREITYRAWQMRHETTLLQELFQCTDNGMSLKKRLVKELREGDISLQNEGLISYLRQQVLTQVAIDQPVYSGFKVACENAGIKPKLDS